MREGPSRIFFIFLKACNLFVPWACVTMAMQDNNTLVKLSCLSTIRNAGFAILGE